MSELVTVLFTRSDTVYLHLGCDCWGIGRDARNYAGCDPLIAHPPCRAWGRLRGLAKPRPDEKDLARFAVAAIRKNGGVLEHPEKSTLWGDQLLPKPGCGLDHYGGWSLSVDQFWWGHLARKRTWLYIVGLMRAEIPAWPISLNAITCVVASNYYTRRGPKRNLSNKKDTEGTPLEFAKYLISIIELIKAKK
jgi:hypothetical protein